MTSRARSRSKTPPMALPLAVVRLLTIRHQLNRYYSGRCGSHPAAYRGWHHYREASLSVARFPLLQRLLLRIGVL
jgi:hypothetical protein